MKRWTILAFAAATTMLMMSGCEVKKPTNETTEMKCQAGKCESGKCQGAPKTAKCSSGKCGEGKCGGN